MKKLSKKNVAITGVAVSLAAVMLVGGGTFAYLKGETDPIKNNFKTNQVLVSLEETTGNDYNIIPGTEQSKDPKITVNNTVDAWVYAIVDDSTQGLVNFNLADGWIPLDGWNNGNFKVFYRAVSANDDVKSFSVLKNDKVSYDKALENSDMVDADGTLKAGVNLTFTAYAIQQDGFADAKEAFENQYAEVTSSDEIETAIEEGKTAVLTADITLPQSIDATGTVNIIGNGNKIVAPVTDPKNTTSRVLSVNNQTEPVTLNIKDAELVGPTTGTGTRGISLFNSENVTINMEDSSLSCNYYAYNIAGTSHNAKLNVKNCEITGWCAFQTWANDTQATFDNCTLKGVNDKKVSTSNKFADVVIYQGTQRANLTFNNCTFETVTNENTQYFLSVRGNNATVDINSCTFIHNGNAITGEDLDNYIEILAGTPADTLTLTID